MRAGKNNEDSADLIGFWFFIGGFGLRIFLGGETSFFLYPDSLQDNGSNLTCAYFFTRVAENHQLIF